MVSVLSNFITLRRLKIKLNIKKQIQDVKTKTANTRGEA